jgi:exodeoxyribonuclease-3
VRAWGPTTHLLAPDGMIEDASTGLEPLARPLREFTAEGRYVEVDLADRPVTVASLYLPKGGLPAHLQKPGSMREAPDGGARYDRKMRFLTGFARQVDASRRRALAAGRDYLLMGDFNIAHARSTSSTGSASTAARASSRERAWLDTLIRPRRLHDVVRRLHPDTQGPIRGGPGSASPSPRTPGGGSTSTWPPAPGAHRPHRRHRP